MTLKRKLGIAAALVAIAVVAMLLLDRNDQPPFAAKFLRYENDGESALIQLTNCSGSAVAYSANKFWGQFIFIKEPRPGLHSLGGILQAHQGHQVLMPATNGASNIVLAYLKVRGSFYSRCRSAMEKLGISITDTERSLTVVLPPKSPLP